MKLLGYKVHLYNPFKKISNNHYIGFNIYKDWYNTREINLSFSILKIPHFIVCCQYTTKDKFITKFWVLSSHKYRDYCGGFKAFEKMVIIKDIEDAREGAC